MKLSPDQFRGELRKMVASPAWAELPGWFLETMLRRVLRRHAQSMQGASQAAADVAGAAAFMLAIENELHERSRDGDDTSSRRLERFGDSKAAGSETRGYGRQQQRPDATRGEAGTEPGTGGTG